MDSASSIACCLCDFSGQGPDDLEAHIWLSHSQIFMTSQDQAPTSNNEDQSTDGIAVTIKTEPDSNVRGVEQDDDHDFKNALAFMKMESSDDEVESEAVHVCEITKKTVRKRIKQHMKRYHEGPPRIRVQKKASVIHPCKVCGVVLPSRSLFKHLKEFHDGVQQTPRKLRKCKECGLIFRSFYQLQDHRWKEHKIGSTWKCQVCQKAFHRHDTFQAHQKIAHKKDMKLTTPCYLCEATFPSKEVLQVHLKDSHAQNWPEDLFCEVCDEIFIGRASLKRHQFDKHDLDQTKTSLPIPITCSKCSKTITDAAGFFLHYRDDHIKTETEPASTHCGTCEESFPDHDSLKSHYRNFHPDRHCDICDKDFNRKEHLQKHRATGRGLCGQSSHHPCKNCPQSFSNKDLLKRHLMEVHDYEWPKWLKCKTCHEIFYNEENLTRHVRLVHELRKYEAPYKCKTCDEKMWTKASLYHHQKVMQHGSSSSSSEPQTCQDCDKTYSDRPTLNRHRKLFHREKPDGESFSCCSQIFKSYSSLKSHRRENRCLRCSLCGKGFYLEGLLRKHQDEVHVAKAEPGVTDEICRLCKGSFESQEGLYKHQQEDHRSEVEKGLEQANNECKVCFVTCEDQDALEVHQDANHSDLKCKVCKTICGNKAALTRHVSRTHKLPHQKPYSCKLCKKRVIGVDRLKNHLKREHQGLWFEDLQCANCGKIFYEKEPLRRHQHAGCQTKEGQFQTCQLCGLLFKSRTAYETHLAFAHGKKNPSCNLCGNQYQRPGDLKRHFAKCIGSVEG